jgi:hypothetical protein
MHQAEVFWQLCQLSIRQKREISSIYYRSPFSANRLHPFGVCARDLNGFLSRAGRCPFIYVLVQRSPHRRSVRLRRLATYVARALKLPAMPVVLLAAFRRR